jgi:hypothetical protein
VADTSPQLEWGGLPPPAFLFFMFLYRRFPDFAFCSVLPFFTLPLSVFLSAAFVTWGGNVSA